MKPKQTKRPPNPAARALRQAEFRQRIVKARKNAGYTRKEKHKKRDDQENGSPSFSLNSGRCQNAPPQIV